MNTKLWNQEWPYITSSNPLGDFVLPVLAILGSAGLTVLVPRRGTLLPGDRASISMKYISCGSCQGTLDSLCPETST